MLTCLAMEFLDRLAGGGKTASRSFPGLGAAALAVLLSGFSTSRFELGCLDAGDISVTHQKA